MNIKLDASHECILNKWEIINEMIACRDQVERYLKALAGTVCGAVYGRHATTFSAGDDIDKHCWFELNPKRLANWKNSGSPLLHIGIEKISAAGLLHLTGSDPCFAYVASNFRSGIKEDRTTDKLDLVAEPPSGFERSLDVPDRGFIFRKVLPALTPKDFLDSAKLGQYFTEPLNTLVDWYKSNESTILKAFGSNPSRKSRN
jgi:hypothetical protein